MFLFILFFFAHENLKKPASKVAHNCPQFFFQQCKPAQIQPKSQLLFHKNLPPRDFSIMTLVITYDEFLIIFMTKFFDEFFWQIFW